MYGSGSLAMQVLWACSQSILLWGFYVFLLFFFVFHSILSLCLCLAFYYYVSVLLVSYYPFYPLWVTGDRDVPWFSLSLV